MHCQLSRGVATPNLEFFFDEVVCTFNNERKVYWSRSFFDMLHSLKQPADSQKLQTHSRLTPASILAKTNGREVKDQVVNAPMND